MMYITQQKEGKVCVVNRDFKFPFWIPESDMRLLKLYSPRQFIITTSQIPQPSTSQVNTSVIQAQSSAEPVVAQSDTDRQGTFASLSGVKTSETATSDNVLASISQEPVKSEPVVSSTETEEAAQSDSEPVENALSFDTLPEEQKMVYQGMSMTLLKNLKPEEIWEHTEKLKAEGLDYDSVIAKLRELNGQSETEDDDDWSDSDDDEWEETEDVTSVLEAEEEEGSENDVIDWESDDDEDDDGVVDYSDDVTGSTDATIDEYDDDGDYYDDDELFPDNLEDSEDWSQDDDDDDEESLSPFYWDWGATIDAINSHDDEALYNGYIPHKIADYPDRTPVNWDSDFAMFQNGATAIDDDEECESIYDYLTPDEVSLFQKYTMYLADRALSFDKGTINIDSLMHKKIESYKATKGSDTEWRYAGFVDMGYKGASRCQFCNSKLNYTAVSSCCGAPITRMGLFTYDHDEEGKPLKQKREVKSYYGKCDVCGAPVSVLMNRQGFDSKSKLRKTTNPSWCAAKVGDDQICGTVVEQNTHYDLLNNAVRFCHLMVNVKKQTMSQFYCDTLLNADISKFIESDDVVKLGIGKAADFLGVAKDSPAFEIFHEVEKTLVNDTISLLNVYKAKKAGKEFDFSFMHSMIDAYLANFDMADFMGTESTETHVIDICILNMAKQMLDSGMVPPISLVRFVRDYFLCWDARQFTISSARYGTPTIANWHLCGGIKGWWRSWKYDDLRKDWKYNNNPEVNADYANSISRSIGTVIDSSGFYTTELYEYLCNVIPQVGVSGLNIYDRVVTYVLRDGILGNYAYLFGSISEGGKSESAISTYKNVYEPANKFVAQLTGTSETSPDSQYRMSVMPKDSEEAKKIKGSKLNASDFADYNALRNISLENFIVILKTAVILRKISSKGYFNLIWTSSNYRSYPFKWADRNSMGFKNAFYNELLSTQTRYLRGMSGTVNPVLVALGFHEDLLYRAGYADSLNSSIEDLKAFINTWESLTTKELGIFTGEIQFTEQVFSELGGKDWRFVPAIKDTLTAVAKKCLDSQIEYRHWDDITKPESIGLSLWSMLMILMYSRRQLLSWCEKTPSLRSTLDSYDEEYISLRGVPGSWRAVNPLTVENAKKVMKEDASDYSDLWYLIVAGVKRGVDDTDEDVKSRPHLLYRSLEAAQKDLSANDGWVSWCRSIANSTLAKAIAEAKNK